MAAGSPPYRRETWLFAAPVIGARRRIIPRLDLRMTATPIKVYLVMSLLVTKGLAMDTNASTKLAIATAIAPVPSPRAANAIKEFVALMAVAMWAADV